jgi:ATP-binding cassette subfamily C protein CydD
LGTHYHARAEAVGAAEEILKIVTVPHLENLNGSSPWVKTEPLHLQLEDVRLAFDGGQRPALQGMSFELKQGEQVAMVGASGAGKSTTLNLLLGFLLPDSGEIKVNGIPLADMAPDSWRRHIAWIGQQPVLFQGTIKENILLGRPQASAMQVEQAAGDARVLDFARHLPEGLNTMVGEHGFGLSRGQAQRVALARAFLKGAPLLLLDEPAAGLDGENEALIIEALETLSRGRTVLMLTHRMTNLKNMSRIMVLEKGRIVEQGTYAELAAAGGRFHKMVDVG